MPQEAWNMLIRQHRETTMKTSLMNEIGVFQNTSAFIFFLQLCKLQQYLFNTVSKGNEARRTAQSPTK